MGNDRPASTANASFETTGATLNAAAPARMVRRQMFIWISSRMGPHPRAAQTSCRELGWVDMRWWIDHWTDAVNLYSEGGPPRMIAMARFAARRASSSSPLSQWRRTSSRNSVTLVHCDAVKCRLVEETGGKTASMSPIKLAQRSVSFLSMILVPSLVALSMVLVAKFWSFGASQLSAQSVLSGILR